MRFALNFMLLVLLIVLSNNASAAVVYYCWKHNYEGSSVKVDPTNNKICLHSGRGGPQFCDAASNTYNISYLGRAQILDQSPTGRTCPDAGIQGAMEFGGTDSNGKWQFIRIFDREFVDKNNPKIIFHRAMFIGGSYNMSTSECFLDDISTGQPQCVAEDEAP